MAAAVEFSELTDAQRRECDAETRRIRENKEKPEARRRHKFKAAGFTHPNGHPRCLVCGDEERAGGYCNDPGVTASRPTALNEPVGKAEPPRGKLPALKMPDPALNVAKLRDRKSTGLLSRLKRMSRIGERQYLVNEISKDLPKSFVWGVVTLDEPERFADLSVLPKRLRDGLDQAMLEEFAPLTRPIFYVPMRLVAAFEPPVQLRRAPPGRRFGPIIDLDRERLKKQDLTPADLEDGGKLPPEQRGAPRLAFRDVSPEALRKFTVSELQFLDQDAHLTWTNVFGPGGPTSLDGLTKEDVLNAEIFLQAEFKRRDLKHRFDDDLARKARARRSSTTKEEEEEGLDELLGALEKAGPSDRFAPIRPGSEGALPELKLGQILEHFDKPFLLRRPLVWLVGSAVNNGLTQNDIDILIKGPLDEATAHILEFRLGRMLPPEISSRVQFHGGADEDPISMGGPFTASVPLFDLVVMPHEDRATKEMCLEAADGILIDARELFRIAKQRSVLLLLPKSDKPRPGILQAHIRGNSLHLDFRAQVDDFLVGWTLAAQRAGKVRGIDSIADAKRLVQTFSMAGSRWNKPLRAPNRLFATPKSTQPIDWLKLKAEEFPVGAVGASRNKRGFMAVIAEPRVSFGIQKPFFHEYFLEGDSRFVGILAFRLLTGQRQPTQEELEAGRRTRRGEPFWTGLITKSLLPSVLKPRAKKVRTLPPLGKSALPPGLEQATPREFQYWKARTVKEQEETRNALIDAKIFTEDSVKLVDNQFRKVVKKYYLDVGAAYEKQLKRVPFALSWQTFKGAVVIRAAPSKQVFHLFLLRDGKVEDFQLLTDPVSGVKQITAIRRVITASDAKELLDFEGDVPPKKKIHGVVLNPTKATPSRIRKLAGGTIEFLEDGRLFKKFRFKGPKLPSQLRGTFTLVAEEAETDIWLFERGTKPSRPIPELQQKVSGELLLSSSFVFERAQSSVEKVHAVEDLKLLDGTVLKNVQVWDPKKVRAADDKGGDRAKLKPLALFKPLKVAPRATNQFRSSELPRVFEDFATDAFLKEGIVAEPKWNGYRLICAKDASGRLLIFTEEIFERKTLMPNFAKTLPGLAKELDSLPGPYVLDGEATAVNEAGDPVPRRDLARFRGVEPTDDEGFRFRVFDAIFLPKEGNLTQKAYTERRRALERFLRGRKGLKRVVLTPVFGPARSRQELQAAMRKARATPGSEGAMLKQVGHTYSLGGESDGIAKVKFTREIIAIVHKKDPVKDSPGVFTLFGAVGPIPKKEADDWKETVEVGGKLYVTVGRTFNSRLPIKIGERVLVEATEILFDASGPKKSIRWFTPVVVDKTDEKPLTVDQVLELLEPGETKKQAAELVADRVERFDPEGRTLTLKRADRPEEERYVLGIVLEPDVVDAQGDTYSEAEVRKACHFWIERFSRFKLMHKGEALGDKKVKILECYCAPVAFELAGAPVKKGSWLLGVRVLDDTLWRDVKEGRLTGFSIGGSALYEFLDESEVSRLDLAVA